MFWRNLFSKVSKLFDSAKNMLLNFLSPMVERVQESFSAATAMLRGFFTTVIAKIRTFFAMVIAKIRSFFAMVIANVRSFFSTIKALFRLIQKLQKPLSLVNVLLDILESEMAPHSKFLSVLKAFNRFEDLGTIFGGVVQH